MNITMLRKHNTLWRDGRGINFGSNCLKALIGKYALTNMEWESHAGVSRQVYTWAQTESYTKHGQTNTTSVGVDWLTLFWCSTILYSSVCLSASRNSVYFGQLASPNSSYYRAKMEALWSLLGLYLGSTYINSVPIAVELKYIMNVNCLHFHNFLVKLSCIKPEVLLTLEL